MVSLTLSQKHCVSRRLMSIDDFVSLVRLQQQHHLVTVIVVTVFVLHQLSMARVLFHPHCFTHSVVMLLSS